MNKSFVIIVSLLVVSIIGLVTVQFRDDLLLSAKSADSSPNVCEDLRNYATTMTPEEYCTAKYEMVRLITNALYTFEGLSHDPQPTDSANPLVQIFLHPMAFPYLNANIQMLREMLDCFDEIDIACG